MQFNHGNSNDDIINVHMPCSLVSFSANSHITIFFTWPNPSFLFIYIGGGPGGIEERKGR